VVLGVACRSNITKPINEENISFNRKKDKRTYKKLPGAQMTPWSFAPVSLPVPSSRCRGCHRCPVLSFPPLSVIGVGVSSGRRNTRCPPCEQLLAAVGAGAGCLRRPIVLVLVPLPLSFGVVVVSLFVVVPVPVRRPPHPPLSCHQCRCRWHPPLSWAFFVWVSSSPPSSPNISRHRSVVLLLLVVLISVSLLFSPFLVAIVPVCVGALVGSRVVVSELKPVTKLVE
jgi:hypothetical protein